MSHALHALHYHATKEHERIPKAQAAKIERAIDAASSGVSDMFGARPDWAFAMHSLTSAKDLARHWAERAPAYGGLGARTIRLPSCHVLWLRNCCYNAALLEEIDEHFIRQASDARRALRSSRLSRCSYLE